MRPSSKAGFTTEYEHGRRMRTRGETECMVHWYTVRHSPRQRIDHTETYCMRIPFNVLTVDR